MAAATHQLGDLSAAVLRTADLFGNRPGVLSIGVAHCDGGFEPHVAIGTDSIATMGLLVSELARLTPVQHLDDAPTPAWIGQANGVQLCVFVAESGEPF